MIWGANTGVGKTLISAGLTRAAVQRRLGTLYLKPVQTALQLGTSSGPLQDGRRGRSRHMLPLYQEEEKGPRGCAAFLLPFAEVVLRVLAVRWRMLGSAVLLQPIAEVVQRAPVSLA